QALSGARSGPPLRVLGTWTLTLDPSYSFRSLVSNQLPHDLAIVERKHRVRKFLVAFVALACNQHAVAGLGHVECEADRPAAIVNPGDFLRRSHAPAHIGKNIRDRLRSRIVGGGEREIRKLL